MLLRKTRTATRLARQAFRRWRYPIAPRQPGRAPRVLFVTEAEGATLRYRVLNQIEQLQIAGLACQAVHPSYHGVLADAGNCNVLVLYRTRTTPYLRRIVATARAQAALIVFDTDDLVWDQRIIEYCNLHESHSQDEMSMLGQSFKRTAQLMRYVDGFVASTPFLADLIRADFPQPMFVNMNALDATTVARSESLFAQHQRRPPAEPIIIGYFSGWPRAHEPDLAVALPGIQRALEVLPQARLRIIGHFDVTRLPEATKSRIELAPFVEYNQLLAAIAEVDINIAPIVNNPHRRAKSAVKFLEAALVGVPTVATELEPYHIIRHGETGYLANDSNSWTEALLRLAQDSQLRATIGAAARAQVLADHTTTVRSVGFAAFLIGLSFASNYSL